MSSQQDKEGAGTDDASMVDSTNLLNNSSHVIGGNSTRTAKGNVNTFDVKVVAFPFELLCKACCHPGFGDGYLPDPEDKKPPVVIYCANCRGRSKSSDPHIVAKMRHVEQFNISRKVVECRRVYSSSQLLNLSTLQDSIDNGIYNNRAFSLTNSIWGNGEFILYVVEAISQNPDNSYILTLSAGFYDKREELTTTFKQNYEVDLNVRTVHKMIPSEYIDHGLHQLSHFQTQRDEIIIEIAVNHPHLFFSKMDGVYTQWESSPKGIIKLFKFLPLLVQFSNN
jgi:hypothetical protein